MDLKTQPSRVCILQDYGLRYRPCRMHYLPSMKSDLIKIAWIKSRFKSPKSLCDCVSCGMMYAPYCRVPETKVFEILCLINKKIQTKKTKQKQKQLRWENLVKFLPDCCTVRQNFLRSGLPISKPPRLNNKHTSRQLTAFEPCFHRTRKTKKINKRECAMLEEWQRQCTWEEERSFCCSWRASRGKRKQIFDVRRHRVTTVRWQSLRGASSAFPQLHARHRVSWKCPEKFTSSWKAKDSQSDKRPWNNDAKQTEKQRDFGIWQEWVSKLASWWDFMENVLK